MWMKISRFKENLSRVKIAVGKSAEGKLIIMEPLRQADQEKRG